MVMTEDIINFVNYVNSNSNANYGKKRTRDELSIEEITVDIKVSAIEKLKKACDLDFKMKGRELTKYMTEMKYVFSQFVNNMKTDKQAGKQIPELLRLWLIAETSVTVSLLEEMIKNATINKTKTLGVLIDDLRNKIIKQQSTHKKIKLGDFKNQLIASDYYLEDDECDKDDKDDNYEEDSDDYSSEDDTHKADDAKDDDSYIDDDNKSSSSDSSSDDEDIFDKQDIKPVNKTNITSYSSNSFNKKNDTEIVSQIFKARNEDDETIALKYFSNLPSSEKAETLENIKAIRSYQAADKPVLFKIMEMPLPVSQKNHILKSYTELVTSRHSENKLRSWFDSLMTIPFGKYKGIDLNNIKSKKVKKFIDNLQKSMDNAVYGHDESKRQIIQMMGQQIRNPKSRGNMLGIYGPPGNGKCFALDTPILMYDGTIKKVQDVQVGDIVLGDDSGPRNVLSLGRGEDEMYEVLSNRNDSYVVNSEHILCLKAFGLDIINRIESNEFKVQYFNKKELTFHYKSFNQLDDASYYLNDLIRKETDDVIEITVKDYLKLSDNIKNNLRGYKVGVNFDSKRVDIDPYIIGIWLGNNITSKLEITIYDLNVLAYLRNSLKNYNINLQHYQNHTYKINCDNSTNVFFETLKNYDLINNKYISQEYKVNDRDSRLKLLAGIIDISGFYDKTIKKYEIINESKQLSDDILFLARSLGFACYQNKTEDYFGTHIYGAGLEYIPVLCPKKKCEDNIIHNVLLNKIELKSKGRGNYYGFTLDGNNRFLLGNFTVTHNTSLIKEGIAKAMDKPFVFISLGGATDSSFLEGHSYTYEGSIYGRIANGLITSKCMDPIIYFDELDKISKSHKGDEITNLLVHLTDPVQNSHFRDKYFHGIDIDLSRATMIFSFNDPHNVNPVLMDRITTVETKYLMISQKIHIVNNYLLPEMMKDMGLNPNDVNMNDETIRYIVNSYTNEGGVRKLKSILYNICRELNLANLTKDTIDSVKVTFPFTVEISHLKTLLRNKMEIEHDKVHDDDKSGIVNGLWANSLGQGGILSIETMLVPSSSALTVKATGHLEKVIKESTEVATSLAWSYLPEDIKTKLLSNWKDRPMGIHIHCPDGATPKDGPSAGAALTLALYSILTGRKIKHDIAMTGEINLEGKVTAIGGLEEKLEGAKRAGVKLVLYPKENQKHINKIKERNVNLIDDNFRVISIETFDDVMKHALVSN